MLREVLFAFRTNLSGGSESAALQDEYFAEKARSTMRALAPREAPSSVHPRQYYVQVQAQESCKQLKGSAQVPVLAARIVALSHSHGARRRTVSLKKIL
mmetsp:Transcript_5462/g.16762  ORF Transcript_5462/g.16762 Transcript_5462/m.16762 type:complete len:99 (-) Transcript_5462:16-312(-)